MKKIIMSRLETTTSGTRVPPVALSAPDPPPPPNLKRMDLRLDWQRPEVWPPLPTYPPPQDYIPNLQGGQEETPTDQTICRDFIRGNCKRERNCKYAHKHDLSQLEGVYTFCRNFQNSVCTFANCKYVHATVFEEQNFYRTGVLRAHALHHKVNDMLQPPPPPPPPPPEDPVAPFNMDFSNPPPILRTE
ncbi:zinc finger CCCH domain-containing protein 10-like [Maniola jurtina]|uniref:zinc finger CCCH domain-containing protein 10-like n=1 Tax=Maniola jurtina TaxID=191418 RepID=UPI001E68FA7A|nr:zinc finger CCCH domain-containing protein 10-like [Maniola jurtina]